MDAGGLRNLERTAERVEWSARTRESAPLYVLFSRARVSDELRQQTEHRADVELFDLQDVLTATRREKPNV